LLCAVAAIAPAALAMPVISDATDGLEAHTYDAEVADLIARFDFDEATSLVARAVMDVLGARNDELPPHQKDDPINGKKPEYSPEEEPHRGCPPHEEQPKSRPMGQRKHKDQPKPKPKLTRKGQPKRHATKGKREVADYWW